MRIVITLMLLFTLSAVSQDTDNTDPAKAPSDDEATQALQKATQNPVGNLISVPLQKQQQLRHRPL